MMILGTYLAAAITVEVTADGSLRVESPPTPSTPKILPEFAQEQCVQEWAADPNKPRLATVEELEGSKAQEVVGTLKEAPKTMHRKLWEYAFIVGGLEADGKLAAGSKGLGLAVGTEPLVPFFASRGAKITATDLAPDDERAKGWAKGNMHMDPAKMDKRHLCDPQVLQDNVQSRYLDMNKLLEDDLYKDQKGTFDFVWSTCAVEHAGSIDLGLKAMQASLEMLKPGGVALHTTEFNLASLEDTLDSAGTVLFRKKDVERFRQEVLDAGYEMEEVCYGAGTKSFDAWVDVEPYTHDTHMRLQIGKYASTCVGLVIRKPA